MPDTLNHYLQTWNLSDPHPLTQTFTSHVYTVTYQGEMVVLKLLTPIGQADEHSGAVALRYFDGHGAVRLLCFDEKAHLLEYVPGQDLVPLVIGGNDAQATEIIADVLNQLHAARPAIPSAGLKSLTSWFQALFDRAEHDQQEGVNSCYTRAAPLAKSLVNNPRDEVVLHGDIHHENIRLHAQRGWLAFDPKGLYGERTYDAANTLLNPMNMPELVENETRLLRTTEILSRKLNIDVTRIRTFVFVYACLSAAWSESDGFDPSAALNIAQIIEPHV